jgi:hypothetical protein
MNLRTASMSGAITLVGVGLLAVSGAVLLVGLGGAAQAGVDFRLDASIMASQGQPRVSKPSSRDRRGLEREALEPGSPGRTSARGAGDGCIGEGPLVWFGPPRSLPLCGDRDFPGADSRYADVNGDGRPDNFLVSGELFVVDGQPVPVPIPIVTLRTFAIEGGEVVSRNRVTLRSDAVAGWVLARTGWTGSVYITDAHWNDLDGNGDLDLVLVFKGEFSWPDDIEAAWLENTGFEATQPLTGDLDGDGAVGASDLTIPLGGWTGQ